MQTQIRRKSDNQTLAEFFHEIEAPDKEAAELEAKKEVRRLPAWRKAADPALAVIRTSRINQ